MKRRDAMFAQRILVMMLVGLAAGIGVATFLTNSQLGRLLPESPLRTALTLIGPLVMLSTVGFGLAHRIHNGRGFVTELAVLALAYSMFLLVALPYFFLRPVRHSECKFWQIGCDNTRLAPDMMMLAPVVLVLISLFAFIILREFVLTTKPKRST